MKKISLITVNYNTEKDTVKLLKSLEVINNGHIDLSVTIVDNGSKRRFTSDMYNGKLKIQLIRSEKNMGFAGGFNMGIRASLKKDFDYILIINNDTMIYSDMLDHLLGAISSGKNIGIVVPKIYFAKGHEFHKNRYRPRELGKVIWYAGGHTDWKDVRSIHRGVDEIDRGQYDFTGPTDFATGCCMMFSREVLEKVGLFDERYFLYYEDADFCERVKRAGFKIYYVPKAVLIHSNAASSGGPGNNLHDYFLTRNQMIFGMTYAPGRSKIALIKQSIRLLLTGRPFQKKGIMDFYIRKFGKGTYFKESSSQKSSSQKII